MLNPLEHPGHVARIHKFLQVCGRERSIPQSQCPTLDLVYGAYCCWLFRVGDPSVGPPEDHCGKNLFSAILAHLGTLVRIRAGASRVLIGLHWSRVTGDSGWTMPRSGCNGHPVVHPERVRMG